MVATPPAIVYLRDDEARAILRLEVHFLMFRTHKEIEILSSRRPEAVSALWCVFTVGAMTGSDYCLTSASIPAARKPQLGNQEADPD